MGRRAGQTIPAWVPGRGGAAAGHHHVNGAAYAGIGSRATPQEVLAAMAAIAGRLARSGWVLRTGMSPGADEAFYRGALAAAGAVELYLPAPGFQERARLDGEEQRVTVLPRPSAPAYALAARSHPGWDRLPADQQDLLARDAHQVLGADLATPARLLVCWTHDGSLDGEGLLQDGTGQALRIAHTHAIPVLNLARAEHAATAGGRIEEELLDARDRRVARA